MIIYDEKIKSNYDAVVEAVHDIDAKIVLYCNLISSAQLFKINFMLREILNNAVEHGNHFNPAKSVHCLVELVDDVLKFQVSDEGEGIHLKDDYLNKNLSQKIEERNRGYSTIRELNFEVEVDGSTVVVSLDLAQEDEQENMKKLSKDGMLRLLLEKDLTANNINALKADVESAIKLEEDFDELVLDLSETQNIDSIGVTFVVNQFKKMQNDGKLFRIVGASEDVKSLFKLMKLDQFFDLED